MRNLLDQLCKAYGVLPEYNDVWGKAFTSSDAVKRALLGAMGVAAHSAAEISASLQAFERRLWERALPPVQVAIDRFRDRFAHAQILERIFVQRLAGLVSTQW